MAQEPTPATPQLFSQLEVSAGSRPRGASSDEAATLLCEIRDGMDRQNELLEELVGLLGNSQRQRASELAGWRQAHPRLAGDCRAAAEVLSRVQAEFVDKLTAEIRENAEAMADGEFVMNEFIDRFGPRLAHLHSVSQVLGQLGGRADNGE